MVIRRTGFFFHASQVGGGRIMAGNAGGLHAAMVHPLHAKGRCAAVAQGAFVARHPGRSNGRNVVGRFHRDIGVGTAMTGLAGSSHNACMIEGGRQPGGETVVAGLACSRGRQVVGRLCVDVGISTAVTAAATGSGNTRM